MTPRQIGIGRTVVIRPIVRILVLLSLVAFSGIVSASALHDGSGVAGIGIEAKWLATDQRLSRMELASGPSGAGRSDSKDIDTRKRFLYVWLSLYNTTSTGITVILHDRSRNYSTELLESRPDDIVRLYRHGDIIPASEYPIRHHRAAFPLTLPSGSESKYIVEYSGPKGIHSDLEISSLEKYIDIAAKERALGGIIAGIFLSLILFNLLSGIIERSVPIVSIAAFTSSIFFFHLRQSRILLLLIDPWAYPEWLYPLTITSNIVFASLLGLQLLRGYLRPVQIGGILGIAGLSIAGTGVAAFTVPYLVADILNLLALAVLFLFFVSIVEGIRSRDRKVVWITISFVPWIAAAIVDILIGWSGVRMTGVLNHLHVFGLLFHLVILTLFLQAFRVSRQRSIAEKTVDSRQLDGNENTLPDAAQRVRVEMIRRTAKDLRAPLDALITTTGMLLQESTEPRLTASLSMIEEDAQALKRMIGESFSATERKLHSSQTSPQVETVQPLVSRMDAQIWIYGIDGETTRHILRILSPYGYTLQVESNRYTVIQAAQRDEIDVLVVDPTDPELDVFTVCAFIRSEHNMLQLPILMITDPFADDDISRGYSSGANDFLTRPIEATELSSRILSLVRLKQVVRHNTDLARSEEEKNTFLYFLTHNVNTPLTIIMNRVRELEQLVTLDDLEEIVEDLTASTEEIHSIVRNVLISFRLADGRQVVRPEPLDIVELLENLSREFNRRSAEKDQVFTMEIPHAVPDIFGDRTAIRAALYNLIDNAIKFSPRGGTIRVTVSTDDAVSVSIQDSGPGVPAEDRPKLFGRFCTLTPRPTGDESSTGLGLYVARELAHMNGGTIEYLDEGSGGTFVLRMPLTHRR